MAPNPTKTWQTQTWYPSSDSSEFLPKGSSDWHALGLYRIYTEQIIFEAGGLSVAELLNIQPNINKINNSVTIYIFHCKPDFKVEVSVKLINKGYLSRQTVTLHDNYDKITMHPVNAFHIFDATVYENLLCNFNSWGVKIKLGNLNFILIYKSDHFRALFIALPRLYNGNC